MHGTSPERSKKFCCFLGFEMDFVILPHNAGETEATDVDIHDWLIHDAGDFG